MITTALHFASVALNTDPVPKPIELTASQKYSILAEQGKHGQRIKSWVKKNYLFSYNMFERNSWEPCPIKPSHLRKWQHRIKKNGGFVQYVKIKLLSPSYFHFIFLQLSQLL